MITNRELSNLGLNETEIKLLNDKWFALYQPNPANTGERLTILREPDGSIAAYENLIDLQERLPLLIPEKNKIKMGCQFIKKHVFFHHVPKELTY